MWRKTRSLLTFWNTFSQEASRLYIYLSRPIINYLFFSFPWSFDSPDFGITSVKDIDKDQNNASLMFFMIRVETIHYFILIFRLIKISTFHGSKDVVFVSLSYFQITRKTLFYTREKKRKSINLLGFPFKCLTYTIFAHPVKKVNSILTDHCRFHILVKSTLIIVRHDIQWILTSSWDLKIIK